MSIEIYVKYSAELNKIRISLHTIFFTGEKSRISALIGRTIFFHM